MRKAAETAGVDYSHLRRGLEGSGAKILPASLRAGLSVEHIRRAGELASSIPALAQKAPAPLRDMYSASEVNLTCGAYTSIIARYLADLILPVDRQAETSLYLIDHGARQNPVTTCFGTSLRVPRYAADAIRQIAGEAAVISAVEKEHSCSELFGLLLPSYESCEANNLLHLLRAHARCVRRNVCDNPLNFTFLSEENANLWAKTLAEHWILQATRSLSRPMHEASNQLGLAPSATKTLKFAQRHNDQFISIMKIIVYAQWIHSGTVLTTEENGFPHDP